MHKWFWFGLVQLVTQASGRGHARALTRGTKRPTPRLPGPPPPSLDAPSPPPRGGLSPARAAHALRPTWGEASRRLPTAGLLLDPTQGFRARIGGGGASTFACSRSSAGANSGGEAAARAGTRRFRRLSAPRTHTNAPYKTDLLRRTLRALERPERAPDRRGRASCRRPARAGSGQGRRLRNGPPRPGLRRQVGFEICQ